MTHEIRYVARKDLDIIKWDACIQSSVNGLCYCDSGFLDAMAPGWSALIMNDYETVMPLTWRKKLGIRYLYQPAFCQQTGIVWQHPVKNITDRFLSRIPKAYKYWDIQLNALNGTTNFPMVFRQNYLLSLDATENELQNNYHRNAVRNLRRALEANIRVKEIPASLLIQLHLARFRGMNNISKEEYASFEKLIDRWSSMSKALIIGAEDRHGNIIASSGYLIYKNRITFIMNGNNEEGLGSGASHLLKDHIIRKYGGTGYILDFEGSDNKDFARFYEQFGAQTVEYYPRIMFNNLPWPLNRFKR